jgi:hypothetical protein
MPSRDDDVEHVVREEVSVFERMFRAVALVKERLERTCAALSNAGIPYAIIGGNAVAAWDPSSIAHNYEDAYNEAISKYRSRRSRSHV